MKITRKFLPGLLAAAFIIAPLLAPAQAADSTDQDKQILRGNDPVVVELFSSQGCGYCPQADDFLAKLSQFDNIIALACHVDYFDTPYWGDPLALPLCGARQGEYVAKLKKGPQYTPQVIVNGDLEAVGYHFEELLQTIQFADSRRMAKPEMSWGDNGKLSVTLPESNLASSDTVVWLARLQEPRHLTVEGGANRGKRIYYVNVITRMGEIGFWDGQKKTVTVSTQPDEETYAYAVLLQNEDGIGRIVGAALLEVPEKSEKQEPAGQDG